VGDTGFEPVTTVIRLEAVAAEDLDGQHGVGPHHMELLAGRAVRIVDPRRRSQPLRIHLLRDLPSSCLMRSTRGARSVPLGCVIGEGAGQN
jgi:hypothetical protein